MKFQSEPTKIVFSKVIKGLVGCIDTHNILLQGNLSTAQM